jgi:hypothetical protein
MSKYSYIFDDVISTATTKEKVKLIIPILVGWAKAGISKKTYSDLNKLKFPTPSEAAEAGL